MAALTQPELDRMFSLEARGIHTAMTKSEEAEINRLWKRATRAQRDDHNRGIAILMEDSAE